MDRIRWQVFNTFLDPQKAMDTVTRSKGTLGCNNANGEPSELGITITGLGLRRKTVENLAPELPDSANKHALARLGEVREIQELFLFRQYRHRVSNGISFVSMEVKTYIPSYMTTHGNHALVSHYGQPLTHYHFTS